MKHEQAGQNLGDSKKLWSDYLVYNSRRSAVYGTFFLFDLMQIHPKLNGRNQQFMENFTPYSALFGGALIGLAATLMLLINGRITGISGIFGGMLLPVKTDALWRGVFIGGLLTGGAGYMLMSGTPIDLQTQTTPLMSIMAGFLVGIGTRMGSGCTSGHGICGIARASKRSFVSTGVFMFTAIVTVFLIRHVLGGAQ